MTDRNPFLKELEELYERQHTWSYFDDDKYDDLFKNHVELIYNFFRHSVIEKLNEKYHSGTGNAISFSLPLKYMQFPESEYMKAIVFSYTPNVADKHLNTLMQVSSVDSNKLRLNIYCDIYRDDFKPLFFHEMKHYVQLSRIDSQFSDYYKLAFAQNGSKIFDDKDVIILFRIVDVVNPMEASAYLEQIYNEAFSRMSEISENYTVNNLVTDILKKYNLDKETNVKLIQKIKSGDNFEFNEYIASLFLINIHELNTKHHHYTFFSRDDYNLPKVKVMREHISSVADDKDQLGDIIEMYAAEIINDKVLMNSLRKSFLKNYTKHKINFKNYINTVVYSAKEDYEKLRTSVIARQYNQKVRNYVRYTDDGKVCAEIVCYDDCEDTKRIFEIYADSISNVIRKMRFLIKLIEDGDNDFEVDYGFGYSFENRVSLLRKVPKFDFEVYIQSMDDVAEAVKLLNKC